MAWHVSYRIRDLSGLVSVADEKSAMEYARQLLANGASKVLVSYESKEIPVYSGIAVNGRPRGDLVLSN